MPQATIPAAQAPRDQMMPDGKCPTPVGVNTRLAHIGNDPFDYHGFINPPVVHASTVLFRTPERWRRGPEIHLRNTRHPNEDALCEAIDALEGSAGNDPGAVGPCGRRHSVAGFVAVGDHALIVDSVYGPTRHFCDTMLEALGVEVEYYDPAIGAGIRRCCDPTPRSSHTEAPGSNTFEMQDIPAISAAAHAAAPS